MKNLVFLLVGMIVGMLLIDRSRTTPPPVPAAPARRSRTLEELAPLTKNEHMDVTKYGSDEAYVAFMKNLVDQLVQENMTAKEATLAADEIKMHLWTLVGFNKDMDLRRTTDRYKRSDKWLEDVEESMYNDDQGDES